MLQCNNSMHSIIPSEKLIDAAGTRHHVVTEAPRIACLVPSITELLFALGLNEQVIARTSFCIHPADKINDIPSAGGTKKIKHRLLRSLAPSHVILNIDENTRAMAEQLAEYVPHLIVTHPLKPADNQVLYQLLGGIFRRDRQALDLCAKFETALAGLQEAAGRWRRQRVLYLIWRDPWMSVARDTYISRTLALINWDTIPGQSSTRYPQIDMEKQLQDDPPDLVLFSTEPYRFKSEHLVEFANAYSYPARRLALIDGEMTSWYGNRAIKGLHYLHEFRSSLAK